MAVGISAYKIQEDLMVPAVLLVLYLVVFAVLGIDPYDRAVWVAENLPIVAIVVLLMATYRRFRFSDGAYVLMACLIFLHTVGGHFTFERVPFDWVTELFGFQRNHYDRMAHFTVGFYAYPCAELLLRRRLVSSRLVLLLFPIFFIVTVAAGYELFEWQYAVHADPGAGMAVLGSQGDVWDAQKDMLADTLGALVATGLFALVYRRRLATLPGGGQDLSGS
jgi:putative membrane protein